MNRCLICLLATLLALATAGPWRAEAEPLITLVSQEHSYSFARQIHFEAEFSSVSPITSVTLFFAAQDDLRVFHAELPVAGDQTKTGAGYTLDLAEYPLRPFARVEFWWRVETRDGSVLETAPAAFLYADNRYDWQRVADEDFQIYWAAEDPGLGHTALRIARDGLERIGTILPDALAQPATIYIYPSLDDYRSALQLAGLEWIGGHADLEWDVILLSAAGGPNGSTELQKKIPHEIAHYVIGQRAGGGSNQVPYWLHEGLAVGNEPWPDPALTLPVVAGDTLRSSPRCPARCSALLCSERQRCALPPESPWGLGHSATAGRLRRRSGLRRGSGTDTRNAAGAVGS
jgi:hypothetical protein